MVRVIRQHADGTKPSAAYLADMQALKAQERQAIAEHNSYMRKITTEVRRIQKLRNVPMIQEWEAKRVWKVLNPKVMKKEKKEKKEKKAPMGHEEAQEEGDQGHEEAHGRPNQEEGDEGHHSTTIALPAEACSDIMAAHHLR